MKVNCALKKQKGIYQLIHERLRRFYTLHQMVLWHAAKLQDKRSQEHERLALKLASDRLTYFLDGPVNTKDEFMASRALDTNPTLTEKDFLHVKRIVPDPSKGEVVYLASGKHVTLSKLLYMDCLSNLAIRNVILGAEHAVYDSPDDCRQSMCSLSQGSCSQDSESAGYLSRSNGGKQTCLSVAVPSVAPVVPLVGPAVSAVPLFVPPPPPLVMPVPPSVSTLTAPQTTASSQPAVAQPAGTQPAAGASPQKTSHAPVKSGVPPLIEGQTVQELLDKMKEDKAQEKAKKAQKKKDKAREKKEKAQEKKDKAQEGGHRKYQN